MVIWTLKTTAVKAGLKVSRSWASSCRHVGTIVGWSPRQRHPCRSPASGAYVEDGAQLGLPALGGQLGDVVVEAAQGLDGLAVVQLSLQDADLSRDRSAHSRQVKASPRVLPRVVKKVHIPPPV